MAIVPYNNSNAYAFANIVNNVTTTVKSNFGILHSVTVNTLGTTPTIQLWDSQTASGTKIGFITPTAPGTFTFDAVFNNGLTVVTTGTAGSDITVNYN